MATGIPATLTLGAVFFGLLNFGTATTLSN